MKTSQKGFNIFRVLLLVEGWKCSWTLMQEYSFTEFYHSTFKYGNIFTIFCEVPGSTIKAYLASLFFLYFFFIYNHLASLDVFFFFFASSNFTLRKYCRFFHYFSIQLGSLVFPEKSSFCGEITYARQCSNFCIKHNIFIIISLGIEKDKKCRVLLNFRNGMKRNFC